MIIIMIIIMIKIIIITLTSIMTIHSDGVSGLGT